MDKMFREVTRTWNPFIGCRHGCRYCYARFLALGRLKNSPRYRTGFDPHPVEEELRRRCFRGGYIFVSDMGDLWSWGSGDDIKRVLEVVENSPAALFLFLTKNPARYHEFLDYMPGNVVLGATIESNIDHPGISSAPSITDRMKAMQDPGLKNFNRLVSIEPILEFSLVDFIRDISRIGPQVVYIGYDNHNNRLPEPALSHTNNLISSLSVFTEVRPKTIREACNG